MNGNIVHAVMIVFLAFIANGCRDAPLVSPNAQSVEASTSMEMSPLPTSSLGFVSPVDTPRRTSQATVSSIYNKADQFIVTYSDEWNMVPNESPRGEIYPELVHLHLDGCKLKLRDGSREYEGVQSEKNLAGYRWKVVVIGADLPVYAVYFWHPHADGSELFIVSVRWPADASVGTQVACQSAAETVLDTAVLLD